MISSLFPTGKILFATLWKNPIALLGKNPSDTHVSYES